MRSEESRLTHLDYIYSFGVNGTPAAILDLRHDEVDRFIFVATSIPIGYNHADGRIMIIEQLMVHFPLRAAYNYIANVSEKRMSYRCI